MFTNTEKEKLKEIYTLFETLDEIYDDLPSETKDKINEYHNEEGSLCHCIRWGLTASEELLEEK